MKKLLLLLFACCACLLSQAQTLHWTPVDEGLYSGSTTVIAVVLIDGVEQTSTQIELAVFSGDECRGTALAVEFPITHRYLAQVNVYGENGHSLTFKAYDHAINQELEMDPEVTVTFTEDGSGTLFAPLELNFTIPTIHNVTSGDWSDPTVWGGTVPGENAIVELGADLTLGEGGNVSVTVAGLTVTTGNTLTIESGSTLVVTGDLVCDDEDGLVIEDGAQLVNGSANVKASYIKAITSYAAKDNGGWYAIASPMNAMPIAGSDFVVPEYDLYRYNEPTHEWENYKAGAFTTFENGRGYLYANSNTSVPEFEGTLNHADVMANVTYTSGAGDLKGFNLIGNPFPHAIYKGEGGAIKNANLASGFYTLNNEGAWHVHTYEDAIMPSQGILVKTAATASLEIVKSTAVATAESSAAKSAMGSIEITIVGDNGADRTIAYLSQGIGLDKMANFSDQLPSLWIHHDDGDYAIAHAGDDSEMLEVCLGNRQTADFTMIVKVKGTNLGHLQLIDMETGATVDLLQQPEYTFHATGNEMESRFKLIFKETSTVGEAVEELPFAYVIDGKIILVGVAEEAVLNVFDMTGRAVSAEGRLTPGVYVLRLMDGNTMRTQKIVIK